MEEQLETVDGRLDQDKLDNREERMRGLVENGRWEVDREGFDLEGFDFTIKKINIKFMAFLLLIYMINTIFYFSWSVPDFYLRPIKR